MVAKDDAGKPVEVPALLLETPEDTRRFLESMKRRELKNSYKDEFDNEKTRLKLTESLPSLIAERCEVGYQMD